MRPASGRVFGGSIAPFACNHRDAREIDQELGARENPAVHPMAPKPLKSLRPLMPLNAIRHQIGPFVVLEWTSPLQNVGEATDLVGACMSHDTDRLLLDAGVLPPPFFELRTRFAGEFLQKLQTYRLRTAVVMSPLADHGARFEEYLREARRGHFCRFFTSRDEALAWLARE